ncbi:MAG: PIN domain-containing protein [Gemmatimonadaceae bacterium]
MTVGLDTSVALRLLIGEPADQAEIARLLLVASTNTTISDLVVGETYFALRHHYGVPHADAVRQLLALIDDARVVPSAAARIALGEALSAGSARRAPGFMDRLIRADYAEAHVEVITFDRNFARLTGVRLLGSSKQ